MGQLKINGSELYSLKSLLELNTKEDIIAAIDKIVNVALDDEKLLVDSKLQAIYEFHTGLVIVNGNRCKYGQL